MLSVTVLVPSVFMRALTHVAQAAPAVAHWKQSPCAAAAATSASVKRVRGLAMAIGCLLNTVSLRLVICFAGSASRWPAGVSTVTWRVWGKGFRHADMQGICCLTTKDRWTDGVRPWPTPPYRGTSQRASRGRLRPPYQAPASPKRIGVLEKSCSNFCKFVVAGLLNIFLRQTATALTLGLLARASSAWVLRFRFAGDSVLGGV